MASISREIRPFSVMAISMRCSLSRSAMRERKR